MIAKTFQGLEEVLAKELTQLGAQDVQIVRRGVSFTGDKELLYRANFFLRTALRILKPILTFEAESTEEVYEQVKAFDWSQLIDEKSTFRVDATVFSDVFRHSQFLQYRVKDAIADHFMEKSGKRPSVRLTNPDLFVSIHVADTRCTLSLDSSGESLHKRGWRVQQTEAPINEVLAAGMLMMAGWDGQSDFIDPMCGSGTILIEAAMMALGIAPGLYRRSFAFQGWKDYDADLFADIYNDDSHERDFCHTIYGSDILRQAVEVTQENIKNAGVSNVCKVRCCDFREISIPETDAMIMFNPPYGERIGGAELPDLYEAIGRKLKSECTGKSAWIITIPGELTNNIHLAPSEKVALKNGDIDCELRKYEMFAGRREDFVRARRESMPDGEADEAQTSVAPERRERFRREDRRNDKPRRTFRREGADADQDQERPRRREDRPSFKRDDRGGRRFDDRRRDDRQSDFRHRDDRPRRHDEDVEQERREFRYVGRDGLDPRDGEDRYEYLRRRHEMGEARKARSEARRSRDFEDRRPRRSKEDRFKGTKGRYRFDDDVE